MASDDLRTHLEGTRQFVRKCFFIQPNEAAFGLLYANAALASQEMATAVLTGGFSIPARQALPKVRVPVVFIHGDKDALIKRAMVTAGQKLMRRAGVSIYAQTGHATFFERPKRFNRELNGFVRAAQKKLKARHSQEQRPFSGAFSPQNSMKTGGKSVLNLLHPTRNKQHNVNIGHGMAAMVQGDDYESLGNTKGRRSDAGTTKSPTSPPNSIPPAQTPKTPSPATAESSPQTASQRSELHTEKTPRRP